MLIARNVLKQQICARCGRRARLTKDHYIPKSCRMSVNEDGNYVGLCEVCNREKADRIVLPEWYRFLGEQERKVLMRYFRYASIYIREHCEDEEVLERVREVEEKRETIAST